MLVICDNSEDGQPFVPFRFIYRGIRINVGDFGSEIYVEGSPGKLFRHHEKDAKMQVNFGTLINANFGFLHSLVFIWADDAEAIGAVCGMENTGNYGKFKIHFVFKSGWQAQNLSKEGTEPGKWKNSPEGAASLSNFQQNETAFSSIPPALKRCCGTLMVRDIGHSNSLELPAPAQAERVHRLGDGYARCHGGQQPRGETARQAVDTGGDALGSSDPPPHPHRMVNSRKYRMRTPPRPARGNKLAPLKPKRRKRLKKKISHFFKKIDCAIIV